MKFIVRIRLFLKRQVDRIHNERIRLSVLQALPFWIASLLAGLVAVLYAKLFALADDVSIALFTRFRWSIFIIAPACFMIAAWIVRRLAPNAKGSGIPQVMASIELATYENKSKIKRFLSPKIIVTKIASSLVMVLGGGAIGREGPTIQIAGSVFHKVYELIPASWPKINRRNMIMTGAAAGLAAAFNTPLGGIVFAVEELTKTHISYFRTALFSAVLIAGLTAQGILGPYLYIGYPAVNGLTTFIFAGVILTSIIGGFGGSLMGKLILRFMAYKSGLKITDQWILIACCGVAMASIAFFLNPVILGSGKTVMTTLLFSADKHVEWYVPLFRFTGPILSFTVGGAGGIFAPALSAGACIGGWIANIFNVSPGNANLLILSGMVAFLTGITRTPFTAAILVLEMTDRHSIIFYLMIAALAANLAALIVDKHSFYDHLKKQYLHEVANEHNEVNDVQTGEKNKPEDKLIQPQIT